MTQRNGSLSIFQRIRKLGRQDVPRSTRDDEDKNNYQKGHDSVKRLCLLHHIPFNTKLRKVKTIFQSYAHVGASYPLHWTCFVFSGVDIIICKYCKAFPTF